MAALAHQFAGLISPLHGSFSADNLPARLTICLINEVCPPMWAGLEAGRFRPKKDRPALAGSSRTVARLIREGPLFVNVARRSI
jgi:hypothetical protein